MIDHLGGSVGVWLCGGGGLGERDDLGGVSPDDGGPELQKFAAGVEAEGGGGGGDGVEHPGRGESHAKARGGLHGGEPGGGERADVDYEGGGARGEVGELLGGVEHGGGGAGGEEGVGDDVHGDEVGDALNEWGLGTDLGEKPPCLRTPLGFGCVWVHRENKKVYERRMTERGEN